MQRDRTYEILLPSERSKAELYANLFAAREGLPLPFPNIWHALDPTKVARDASWDEIPRSYLEFDRLCRRPLRKRHVL